MLNTLNAPSDFRLSRCHAMNEAALEGARECRTQGNYDGAG